VVLRQHLSELDGDLVRETLGESDQQLMSADAQVACNAGYGERTPARTNSRNGYRAREWDTRAGTIELAIPKLRHETNFPRRLLEPRRRAEQAMVGVIAQCYIEGVSTRRVEDIAHAMGIVPLSKS
jgi:transposase-like protein